MPEPIIIDRPSAVRTYHLGWFVFIVGCGMSIAAILTDRSPFMGDQVSQIGALLVLIAEPLNRTVALIARRFGRR